MSSASRSSQRSLQKCFTLIALATIALLFTNCMKIGTPGVMNASSLGRDLCSARLEASFEKTYFPFLSDSNRCNHCHSTTFGSTDPGVAFNSFFSRSLSTIDYKAVTAHGGNSNSSSNQSVIDTFRPTYIAAQSTYQDCKARLGNGNAGVDIMLMSKNLPVLATHDGRDNSGWKKLTWQINAEARTAAAGEVLNASVDIEVRRYISGTRTLGLQFRRPTITMNAGQSAVSIAAIKIFIDEISDDQITAYEYLDVAVPEAAKAFVLATTSAPFTVREFSEATTVALEFQSVAPYTAPPVVVPTPTPTPTGPVLPTAVTYSELIAANGNNNIFAKNCLSCHGSANPGGGLDLTSYDQAVVAKDQILSRIKDSGRPMPTSGLMDERSIGVVDVWIKGGLTR